MDEARRRLAPGRRVKIFATDVDPDADRRGLDRALRARHRETTSPPRGSPATSPGTATATTVRQEIRQLVVFANHNMISDPPFSNIDLICCRNVLIYFRHSVQQKIIAAFHFSLKRDGFVFFGSSETIGELKSHFEPLDERLAAVQEGERRAPARPPRARGRQPLAEASRVGSVTLPPMASLLRSSRPQGRDAPFDHVKDSLINDFVPACLILDSDKPRGARLRRRQPLPDALSRRTGVHRRAGHHRRGALGTGRHGARPRAERRPAGLLLGHSRHHRRARDRGRFAGRALPREERPSPPTRCSS